MTRSGSYRGLERLEYRMVNFEGRKDEMEIVHYLSLAKVYWVQTSWGLFKPQLSLVWSSVGF